MKPESRNYLEKAKQKLDRAERALQAQLPDLAAREAYLAVLAAARAIIFELSDVVTRTHTGASSKFRELVARQELVGADLITVLDDGRRMKAIVDYEFGQLPTAEVAREYFARAGKFVAAIETLLEADRL